MFLKTTHWCISWWINKTLIISRRCTVRMWKRIQFYLSGQDKLHVLKLKINFAYILYLWHSFLFWSFKIMYLNAWGWAVRPEHVACIANTNTISCGRRYLVYQYQYDISQGNKFYKYKKQPCARWMCLFYPISWYSLCFWPRCLISILNRYIAIIDIIGR